jgi:hypothetical protein
MQSVTSKFLDAIRQSHQIVATADLYYNRALTVADVPITDGSISVDRKNKMRRSGSVTIGDPLYFPTFVNSPLSPYGSELNLKAGITFPDGTTETVSLGWFIITNIEQETAPSQSAGRLPVATLKDRSWIVQGAVMRSPLDRGGWSAMTLVHDMITNPSRPDITVNFAAGLTDYIIPQGTVYQGDGRLDIISQICEGMGADWYFDVTGNVQVVPVPALTQSTPVSAAVWTVDASTAEAVAAGASKYGVLVQAKRGVSRESLFNAVTVVGTATGSGTTPPQATVVDVDPRSPTFYGLNPNAPPTGLFGEQGSVVTNSACTTTTQCTTAATAILADSLGLARSLDFSTWCNPALEAGDIVQCIYPDGKTELHLLDSFTVPLTASGGMSASTRTLTYQTSGGT